MGHHLIVGQKLPKTSTRKPLGKSQALFTAGFFYTAFLLLS